MSVQEALVKHRKQISFYKKCNVIITSSKVKTYIFNTKFLFEDSLISVWGTG